MKEYAILPPAVVADPSHLQQWLARSFAYVRSLPAKPRKAGLGKPKRPAKA
jgi:hypothetical protein